MAATAEALGRMPVAWEWVIGRGFTPAERWRIRFDDGTSAFVKAGVTEPTADWLRTEQAVYSSLRAPYLPVALGWHDGDLPVLVLEDLSDAEWPPPWSPEKIARVRTALDQVAATPPPAGLPSLERLRPELTCWARVGEDPEPFLRLGVCTEQWFERASPVLAEAERGAVLEGDAFLHFDVRSDNVCFAGPRTLLVDWNWACVGNPRMEVAVWAGSLELEGGPKPEELLPGEPEIAALVAGYFGYHAGLPFIPEAPRVRAVQKWQLLSTLPWAARELGLPPPDGPDALR